MKWLIAFCIAVFQLSSLIPIALADNAFKAQSQLPSTISSGWWDCTITPTKTVYVNSNKSLIKAIKKAEAGTEILLADGHYTFDNKMKISSQGKQCQPIVIKSQNLGNAIISRGNIVFDGASWLTFSGVTFKTVTRNNIPPVLVKNSEYVRITRINFDIQSEDQSKWVEIKTSRNVRIDHSEFQGRDGPGNYINVRNPSQKVNIDHNYFHDRANIGGNGGESIYLHGLHGHRWDMDTIIEYNLFENLDAEWELIGIKSHQNTIRNNTFINNQGTVSIRGGDYNKVYGNYFLNYTTKPTGAVRIHGRHNKVINNYAFGLTSSFIETYWGDRDIPYINRNQRLAWWENHNNNDSYTIQEVAYRKSVNNVVAFNTVVDSAAVFYWNKKCLHEYKKIPVKKRPYVNKKHEYVIYPPQGWSVANNLVIDINQLAREKFVERGDMPCTKAKAIHERSFSWVGNVINTNNANDNFAGERAFSDKQWRIQRFDKHETETPGVYSVAPLIYMREFKADLGIEEESHELSEQLKNKLYIGFKHEHLPLTKNDVGPLSL